MEINGWGKLSARLNMLYPATDHFRQFDRVFFYEPFQADGITLRAASRLHRRYGADIRRGDHLVPHYRHLLAECSRCSPGDDIPRPAVR